MHDYINTNTNTTSSSSKNNNNNNNNNKERTPPTTTTTTHMNEIKKAFIYYKYHILGTALSWFLLDIDFYANGLFNHEITNIIFSTPNHTNTALENAYYSGILCLISLPGYYLSILYIEKIGRKNLQMFGFFCMAIMFFLCALSYDWLMQPTGGIMRKYIFLLIYALTFLFRYLFLNTMMCIVC